MEMQNITLSLPTNDVRRAKVLAARRGTSVSRLLAEMLEDLIARDTGYAEAKEQALAMLARGWDLGTGGRMDVSRDEIHER